MQSILMVYFGRRLTQETQVRRLSPRPNAAWIKDPDTISDKYLYSPSGTIDPLSSR